MFNSKMLRLITTPDEVLFNDLIVALSCQKLRVPSDPSQTSGFIQ